MLTNRTIISADNLDEDNKLAMRGDDTMDKYITEEDKKTISCLRKISAMTDATFERLSGILFQDGESELCELLQEIRIKRED
ncbi:MAG: hypothetical protein ACRDBO_14795 [Lachnospiraceae bacterium]